MNTVQGPIFSDAEVNQAANLTYSENRLADIHGITSGEPLERIIFCLCDWELMTDKLREVLFQYIQKIWYYSEILSGINTYFE